MSGRNNPPSTHAPNPSEVERQQRLARALRENLKRRKAQLHERGATSSGDLPRLAQSATSGEAEGNVAPGRSKPR